MAKRSVAGARVIVTGASSGIGRALAIELAGAGARLLLIARRQRKLSDLSQAIVALGAAEPILLAGDITDPAVRQEAIRQAEESFGGLDILVNNAGIGALGRFEDTRADSLRQIMEVNFFATAEMIREALPLLKRGQRPLVVNVGSILGHRAVPWSSEYCASKFAVTGFSESLRAEFSRLGIDVLVVSPGTTDTDFDAHRIEKQGEAPWPKQRGVPAESVARATLRAIRRGRHEIIPNNRGRLLCWLNRLSPRLMDRFMTRYA